MKPKPPCDMPVEEFHEEGLLFEGVEQLRLGRVSKQNGSVRAVFGRMREWFQRNF